MAELLRPDAPRQLAIGRIRYELVPHVRIAVGLRHAQLARGEECRHPGTRRPILALHDCIELEIRIIEREVGFQQVHRQPGADPLGWTLLVEVRHHVTPSGDTGEKHLWGDPDQHPTGEVWIGGKILQHRQRRCAYDCELDRPFAGRFLPYRQLHVEQHARSSQQNRITTPPPLNTTGVLRAIAVSSVWSRMRKCVNTMPATIAATIVRCIVGRMSTACVLAPNIPRNSSHAFAKLCARKNTQVTFTSAYVSKPSPSSVTGPGR